MVDKLETDSSISTINLSFNLSNSHPSSCDYYPQISSILTHKGLVGYKNKKKCWTPEMEEHLKYFLKNSKYWTEKIDPDAIDVEELKLKPLKSESLVLPSKFLYLYLDDSVPNEESVISNINSDETTYIDSDDSYTIDKKEFMKKLRLEHLNKKNILDKQPWDGATVENSCLINNSIVDLPFLNESNKRARRLLYKNDKQKRTNKKEIGKDFHKEKQINSLENNHLNMQKKNDDIIEFDNRSKAQNTIKDFKKKGQKRETIKVGKVGKIREKKMNEDIIDVTKEKRNKVNNWLNNSSNYLDVLKKKNKKKIKFPRRNDDVFKDIPMNLPEGIQLDEIINLSRQNQNQELIVYFADEIKKHVDENKIAVDVEESAVIYGEDEEQTVMYDETGGPAVMYGEDEESDLIHALEKSALTSKRISSPSSSIIEENSKDDINSKDDSNKFTEEEQVVGILPAEIFEVAKYILRPESSRISLPHFIYEMFETLRTEEKEIELEAVLKLEEEEEAEELLEEQSEECVLERLESEYLIRTKTDKRLNQLFTNYNKDILDAEESRCDDEIDVENVQTWSLISRRTDGKAKHKVPTFKSKDRSVSTKSSEPCFITDLKKFIGRDLVDAITTVLIRRPPEKPIGFLIKVLRHFMEDKIYEKKKNKLERRTQELHDKLTLNKYYKPRRFKLPDENFESSEESTEESSVDSEFPSDYDPFVFIPKYKEPVDLSFLQERISSVSSIKTKSDISFDNDDFLSVTSRMTIGSSIESMTVEEASDLEITMEEESEFPLGYAMDPFDPPPFDFDGEQIFMNRFNNQEEEIDIDLEELLRKATPSTVSSVEIEEITPEIEIVELIEEEVEEKESLPEIEPYQYEDEYYGEDRPNWEYEYDWEFENEWENEYDYNDFIDE